MGAAACQPLETSVERLEAQLILEPFFQEALELFQQAGYDRVSKTRFGISGDMHDSPRHFAGCREDGGLILVAPEMVELPVPTVIAIMAHEVGHACDFLYPGRFSLTESGIREFDFGEATETQRLRRLRAWQLRDSHDVELTADRLAESVYGTPIGYTGPCLLQTFRGGQPRPEHLR